MKAKLLVIVHGGAGVVGLNQGARKSQSGSANGSGTIVSIATLEEDFLNTGESSACSCV